MIFNKNDAGKGYAMSRLRNNRKKSKKSLRRPKFRPPSSAMFKKKESGPLPFQAPTSILRWLGESQRLPSRGNKKATKVVHYPGNVVLLFNLNHHTPPRP